LQCVVAYNLHMYKSYSTIIMGVSVNILYTVDISSILITLFLNIFFVTLSPPSSLLAILCFIREINLVLPISLALPSFYFIFQLLISTFTNSTYFLFLQASVSLFVTYSFPLFMYLLS
jgi:hypothetical protein